MVAFSCLALSVTHDAPDDCVQGASAQLRQLCQDVPCVVALDQGRVAGFLGALLTDFRGVRLCAGLGPPATGSAYHVYCRHVRRLGIALAGQRLLSAGDHLFAHERVAMEAWISWASAPL
ncbi:MAG: hypothetical protein R3A10_22250 [Caldilineaceae bacterium]